MNCVRSNPQKKNKRSQNPDVLLIAILGFCGVGRTSLINRITKDQFLDRTLMSNEDEYSSVYTSTTDEHPIKMQFVSPQIKTDSSLEYCDWYKDLSAVIVCYDTTDIASFNDFEIAYWWTQLKRNHQLPMIVVGNRTDESSSREVSQAIAKKWGQACGIPTIDVSCKTGENITEMLFALNNVIRKSQNGFALRIISNKRISESCEEE